MFEKEIKFIADFNLNKVKSLGSFITFEKLRSSTIHPAIIQYISAELDYLISEDRNRLLQESVFDYTGAEASKYFNLIAQEVKKNKKISFEDLKNLVIQAVSFNLNYLARPKWSLSKLIYNDEQSRSIEEIKLNLNYIYFYDYIKSIFFSYISKRKLITLSITEFELIINKIDNELFSAQPKKLVDYSLYSMAEFFNLGDVSKTKISVLILELFFKEKNLMEYLFRLRKAAPEDTNPKFDIEDIKNIIYSTVPVEAQPIVPEKEISESEESHVVEEIQPEEEEEKEFVLPLPEVNEPVFAPELNETEFIAEEVVEDSFEEKIDEVKADEEISELLTEEDVPEQKIEDNIFEEEIEDKVEEKIEEKAKEIEQPEEEINIPAPQEPHVIEVAEEEIELPIEPEEQNDIVPEMPVQEEETKNEDIISGQAASLSDEDFFSLFNDEVKKIEENDAERKTETEESKTEAEKKADVDSFFDFEEETENLLRAFKETEDEMNSKDIELFQDTSSPTEKAAMDLIKDFHNGSDEKDTAAPPIKKNNDDIPVKRNGKYKEKKNKNILDSISNNDVGKIISNVFNDDRKDFTGTMERLNECTNYDEATEILKSVFLTYRVNPYTKDALTLTNSVANYFTQV